MNEIFDNIASITINTELPRADAEEFLLRLVAWLEEQDLVVNGSIRYVGDGKAFLRIANNQVVEDLGIKRNDEV